MNPPYSIRLARPEDAPSVVGLIGSDPAHLVSRDLESVLAFLDTFWVADAREEIVGCVCLEVYSPRIAEVRSLVVAPAWRGHGIGKALALTAAAEARRRHIAEILVVTSSPQFFTDLGFTTCLNERFALFWKPD